MADSIFSKWWFWVIIVVVLLSVFTPLGIFLKHLFNMQPCSAWETDNSLGWDSDCKQGYVCVPKDKEAFCLEKYGSKFCSAGTRDLAEGHTINNPARGICKPSVAGAFP